MTTFPPLGGPTALGLQLVAELYGCLPATLGDALRVEQCMNDAARACGATIIESVFHRFNPQGASGVVIIAESHLAIHTWPELGYAAVDVFTCGASVDPHAAVRHLAEAFGADRIEVSEVHRGLGLRRLASEGIDLSRADAS